MNYTLPTDYTLRTKQAERLVDYLLDCLDFDYDLACFKACDTYQVNFSDLYN